ncbi:Kinesin-associated protein [Carpediemonas membranifera]|uniref:Kinesin-associated protein n=1 Tax=Carpediemonas membranifera TaxID=201153 RepID=A0A8J6BDV4_9EUKA|nr:Kinesin-associated protein [Carpediemonas membranifera]|eukprot:KAG9395427.1 Kinesin-associated protein [Carpediemonas membranifera]
MQANYEIVSKVVRPDDPYACHSERCIKIPYTIEVLLRHSDGTSETRRQMSEQVIRLPDTIHDRDIPDVVNSIIADNKKLLNVNQADCLTSLVQEFSVVTRRKQVNLEAGYQMLYSRVDEDDATKRANVLEALRVFISVAKSPATVGKLVSLGPQSPQRYISAVISQTATYKRSADVMHAVAHLFFLISNYTDYHQALIEQGVPQKLLLWINEEMSRGPALQKSLKKLEAQLNQASNDESRAKKLRVAIERHKATLAQLADPVSAATKRRVRYSFACIHVLTNMADSVDSATWLGTGKRILPRLYSVLDLVLSMGAGVDQDALLISLYALSTWLGVNEMRDANSNGDDVAKNLFVVTRKVGRLCLGLLPIEGYQANPDVVLHVIRCLYNICVIRPELIQVLIEHQLLASLTTLMDTLHVGPPEEWTDASTVRSIRLLTTRLLYTLSENDGLKSMMSFTDVPNLAVEMYLAEYCLVDPELSQTVLALAINLCSNQTARLQLLDSDKLATLVLRLIEDAAPLSLRLLAFMVGGTANLPSGEPIWALMFEYLPNILNRIIDLTSILRESADEETADIAAAQIIELFALCADLPLPPSPAPQSWPAVLQDMALDGSGLIGEGLLMCVKEILVNAVTSYQDPNGRIFDDDIVIQACRFMANILIDPDTVPVIDALCPEHRFTTILHGILALKMEEGDLEFALQALFACARCMAHGDLRDGLIDDLSGEEAEVFIQCAVDRVNKDIRELGTQCVFLLATDHPDPSEGQQIMTSFTAAWNTEWFADPEVRAGLREHYEKREFGGYEEEEYEEDEYDDNGAW